MWKSRDLSYGRVPDIRARSNITFRIVSGCQQQKTELIAYLKKKVIFPQMTSHPDKSSHWFCYSKMLSGELRGFLASYLTIFGVLTFIFFLDVSWLQGSCCHSIQLVPSLASLAGKNVQGLHLFS